MRKRTRHIIVVTQEQFQVFVKTLTASGNIVITSTVISLLIANSPIGENFIHFWHQPLPVVYSFHPSIEGIINDVFMTFFFLLVGQEIKRELLIGALSNIKTAVVPFAAALGGMLVPALIFTIFNFNQPTQIGWAIPMATDIAFALAVLNLIKHKINKNIIVLLTTLAVVDDLGAVVVIAIFYSAQLHLWALMGAAGILLLLFLINRFKVQSLWIYLPLGLLLWIAVSLSGIHSTIAGVLLAFLIPIGEDEHSSFHTLLHFLEKPVNYMVLPLFALCNTAIIILPHYIQRIFSPLAIGIIVGLFVGKPLGIMLFSFLSVKFGWGKLPRNVKWKHFLGISILGGIGFTMSIFVTILAFTDSILIEESKLYIILGSCLSALVGVLWLSYCSRKTDIILSENTPVVND